MEHLLQRPLPGEIWSSTLLRSSRRTGLPITTVMRALTGRKWSPGFFHCGYVQQLAPLLRQDPHEVLWGHTILGYATAFYAPDLLQKALAAVSSTGHEAIGSGVVVQGVSDYVPFRRFCKLCARLDRSRWGESYWHVAHNLPGVLICSVHNGPLHTTELPAAGPRSWSYALPHEASGTPATRHPVSSFQQELMRRSTSLIGHPPPSTKSARSVEWYRRVLEERGWALQGRAVSGGALVDWFTAIVGRHPERLGLTAKEASLEWATLMIRPGIDIPFAPIKHLMFEAALAVGQELRPPTLIHKPSGKSKRPTAELDRHCAIAVHELAAGYRRQNRSVRLCDLLVELGCWSQFRHDRSRFPLLSSAVQSLRYQTGR